MNLEIYLNNEIWKSNLTFINFERLARQIRLVTPTRNRPKDGQGPGI